ncbi:hypothetical protein ACTQ5K_18585 [Niallia sp. Sow4_A1]|nr:hypothetical protein [Bacillus sp. T2.9-1]MCM3363913.1 hypothetical protein [Niallia sp. MER TA 168]
MKRAVENHLYNIRHYKQKAIKKIEVHYAMFGFHAIVIFHDEKDVAYTYMYNLKIKGFISILSISLMEMQSPALWPNIPRKRSHNKLPKKLMV